MTARPSYPDNDRSALPTDDASARRSSASDETDAGYATRTGYTPCTALSRSSSETAVASSAAEKPAITRAKLNSGWISTPCSWSRERRRRCCASTLLVHARSRVADDDAFVRGDAVRKRRRLHDDDHSLADADGRPRASADEPLPADR